MTGPELDEIIRELYVLPPTQFVAARDELVRQARTAGSADVAGRLQQLRRPTRSAWLVNLLARDAALMQQLATLGRSLRNAQDELAHAELRTLAEQRRHLIARLMERTRTLAEEAGVRPTATLLSEVEATLQAALVDLAGALTVRNGRLVRPLSHTGFGPRARARVLEDRVGRPRSEPPVEPVPEPLGVPVEDELARRRQGHPGLRLVELVDITDQTPVVRGPGPAPTVERRPSDPLRRAEEDLAEAEAAHWQAEFELADAEGAVEAAADRLDSLDTARIAARRDRVTAQRHLAEAQSQQRSAVAALAEARRRLEAAHTSSPPDD
jgi:hypothetical protein